MLGGKNVGLKRWNSSWRVNWIALAYKCRILPANQANLVQYQVMSVFFGELENGNLALLQVSLSYLGGYHWLESGVLSGLMGLT